ncbi:HIPL1 protein [Rhynchospora pubera]|uniref:HIPL1 protein n=1 Tax=Rhynchospora pubera TaxID=906938 RepID=A0AAV8ESR4_9POAL|nr:HIPL1 protein [Rhynchospora pubera]
MRVEIVTPVLLLSTLLLLPSCFSLPLCTDSTSPITRNTTLAFCGYSGSTCCNATDDSAIQSQFSAMNIADSSCASVMKSIICAKCNPYSGELYTVDDTPRTTPILCSNITDGFCATTWDTCKNVAITNNPFASTSAPTKLSDLYHSEADFCMSAGGPVTDQTVCLNGNSASFPPTIPASPEGICIEKLDNATFVNMAPHPDGSNRVFLLTQAGKIFLAEVPNNGMGTLTYNSSQPFLDLTDRVYVDYEFGLQGIVFHPNFTNNGRFFVSYNCDSKTTPNCLGKCSCNPETGCDPSVIGIIDGAEPCQYQEVVAEYTVNGTSSSPVTATIANQIEVQRIFTMGLPYTTQHAAPADIISLGLFGNYTIPSDNPFNNDTDSRPEIWALGFRNPWKCNYDSERPSYLFCGESGQDRANTSTTFEKVSLVTKAGNYGWRVYDGFDLYNPTYTPGGSTPPSSINPIFPILGYYHYETHSNTGLAAVVAGFVYRAKTDPCLFGRFVYADLYGFDMWTAAEIPYMSGNFTTERVNFTCSKQSPIPCDFVDSTTIPKLISVFSINQDNNEDLFFIAQTGVYRIVRSVHCGYKCNRDPENR